MDVHTGAKPLKCRFCDYSTREKTTLQNHESREHTGERPYKCDFTGCDYTGTVLCLFYICRASKYRLTHSVWLILARQNSNMLKPQQAQVSLHINVISMPEHIKNAHIRVVTIRQNVTSVLSSIFEAILVNGLTNVTNVNMPQSLPVI